MPTLRQATLNTPKKGTFPCLSCTHCNSVIKGDNVKHPHTGEEITLKCYATCNDSFVIYALKCPCGLLYIGETSRALKIRLSEHKSNIRLAKDKNLVALHFSSMRHQVAQLKFQVLEVVEKPNRGGDRTKLLKQREAWWIYRLDTLSPRGMNVDWDLSSYL